MRNKKANRKWSRQLKKEPMRIINLQNFSYDRGTDRFIDIARMLHQDSFILCGKSRNKWGDAVLRSIPSNVEIAGYLDPHDALCNIDVLLRLTRRDDPWGRDVIEALSMGVPVIATGTWHGFVKNGINGYLVSPYSLATVVTKIQAMRDRPIEFNPTKLFGPNNARRMEKIYEGLVCRQP